MTNLHNLLFFPLFNHTLHDILELMKGVLIHLPEYHPLSILRVGADYDLAFFSHMYLIIAVYFFRVGRRIVKEIESLPGNFCDFYTHYYFSVIL